MEEKNELNDLILNKDSATNNNKKIILAVATLGVILIIVVMLMNSLSSNGTDNLPQPILSEALLPPEPKNTLHEIDDEPLFEEIEIIEDDDTSDNSLDKIAQRLKQESLEESNFIADTTPKYTPVEKPVVKKVVQPVKHIEKIAPKVQTVHTPKAVQEKKDNPYFVDKRTVGKYYLQVGSFSVFEPNKKFLKSITDKGFTYKYHEVTINSKKINKVLIGPFSTKKEARDALRTVRSSVEAGAFLTEI